MLILRFQKSIRKTFTRNYKIANLLDPCLHQPRPSYSHRRPRRADVLQPPTDWDFLAAKCSAVNENEEAQYLWHFLNFILVISNTSTIISVLERSSFWFLAHDINVLLFCWLFSPSSQERDNSEDRLSKAPIGIEYLRIFKQQIKNYKSSSFFLPFAHQSHSHQRPLRAGVLQPLSGHSLLRCAVESTKIKSIISFTFFKIQSNDF